MAIFGSKKSVQDPELVDASDAAVAHTEHPAQQNSDHSVNNSAISLAAQQESRRITEIFDRLRAQALTLPEISKAMAEQQIGQVPSLSDFLAQGEADRLEWRKQLLLRESNPTVEPEHTPDHQDDSADSSVHEDAQDAADDDAQEAAQDAAHDTDTSADTDDSAPASLHNETVDAKAHADSADDAPAPEDGAEDGDSPQAEQEHDERETADDTAEPKQHGRHAKPEAETTD